MKDIAFGKENFIVIAIAVVLIIVGFVMMTGGGSADGVSFNPALFNGQRIVVAPVITVLGFAIVVVGIMRKPKDVPKPGAEKNKA
jgi:uncharacterized membrane protein